MPVATALIGHNVCIGFIIMFSLDGCFTVLICGNGFYFKTRGFFVDVISLVLIN